MTRFFRFEVDGLGIYAAVEKDCPRDDTRRENKPDGSWLPRVGKDYPGAISFWKKPGLDQYESSGLRDWHLSVTSGKPAFVVATCEPENILYEDEFQIICKPESATQLRSFLLQYDGPVPGPIPEQDTRPEMIRHHSSVRDWCSYAAYPQSDETFSIGSQMGERLGLKRAAFNHEILRPGKRSSWPHAHKVEEELVYILSGQPDIWVNGRLYHGKPGDLFFFPFATGLSHTVINNTDHDVELAVLGEQDKEEDWVIYPMHPERNEEIKQKGFLWEDVPEVEFGKHKGMPGEPGATDQCYQYKVNWREVSANDFGGPGLDNKVHCKDRDLARAVGAKRLACHHVTLPAGKRSSLPHAESSEEEFIYVLSGNPIAWINGHRYPLKMGDGVAFPSGTGVLHTFLNETEDDVELLVTGELSKDDNLCAFPLNPEEKELCPIWWEDPPKQELGSDSPIPKS